MGNFVRVQKGLKIWSIPRSNARSHLQAESKGRKQRLNKRIIGLRSPSIGTKRKRRRDKKKEKERRRRTSQFVLVPTGESFESSFFFNPSVSSSPGFNLPPGLGVLKVKTKVDLKTMPWPPYPCLNPPPTPNPHPLPYPCPYPYLYLNLTLEESNTQERDRTI